MEAEAGVMSLQIKKRGGATSQGMQVTFRSKKGKKTNSPLDPPKGTSLMTFNFNT